MENNEIKNNQNNEPHYVTSNAFLSLQNEVLKQRKTESKWYFALKLI